LGTPRDSLIPEPSPLSKKLHLNKPEVDALLAFIATLTTPTRRILLPKLPI